MSDHSEDAERQAVADGQNAGLDIAIRFLVQALIARVAEMEDAPKAFQSMIREDAKQLVRGIFNPNAHPAFVESAKRSAEDAIDAITSLNASNPRH